MSFLPQWIVARLNQSEFVNNQKRIRHQRSPVWKKSFINKLTLQSLKIANQKPRMIEKVGVPIKIHRKVSELHQNHMEIKAGKKEENPSRCQELKLLSRSCKLSESLVSNRRVKIRHRRKSEKPWDLRLAITEPTERGIQCDLHSKALLNPILLTESSI